jgi:hypothetical protein
MTSRRAFRAMQAAACLLSCAGPTPWSAAAAPAIDYAQASSWLCRPGRDDACSQPLTSTIVSPADGTFVRKTYSPDPAAPIDCFYVYPTVSQDPAGNSDMIAGPEETHAATEQLAPLAGRCRTFAPLYRQTTVAAMRGEANGADAELAYADVLAAWRAYLAHDNHGRGVVLIGHSQGAHRLIRLIAEEIEGKPAERLLVSAILTGGNLEVPPSADTGGSFRHIGLCRAAGQTGCVIAYSSFLADHPPGPDAPFGRAYTAGQAIACVDPAELLGHATLSPALLTIPSVARVLGTTMVENPGVVSAKCATLGDRTFLAISVSGTGAAAGSLRGALAALDRRAPGWGLHPLDISLALGDLVEIVGRQSKARSQAHSRPRNSG